MKTIVKTSFLALLVIGIAIPIYDAYAFSVSSGFALAGYFFKDFWTAAAIAWDQGNTQNAVDEFIKHSKNWHQNKQMPSDSELASFQNKVNKLVLVEKFCHGSVNAETMIKAYDPWVQLQKECNIPQELRTSIEETFKDVR